MVFLSTLLSGSHGLFVLVDEGVQRTNQRCSNTEYQSFSATGPGDELC